MDYIACSDVRRPANHSNETSFKPNKYECNANLCAFCTEFHFSMHENSLLLGNT